MTNGMSTFELVQLILLSHSIGIAQILDELQGAPYQQAPAPPLVFVVTRKAPQVALVRDPIAESVLGCFLTGNNLSAQRGDSRSHFCPPLFNLAMNLKAFLHVF